MTATNSFQVSIKNVGLIRKGHIEFFPGFTVIRGPSGSGKSTLIRAIEDTIYNTPGDSTVTFGEVEQAVGIIYNGTTVIRKRDLKSKDGKVVYKVNGEIFSKTGRSALDEVVKPLMMDELELLTDKVRLNFVNQFSVPFLVKESPSKIFEIVTSDSQTNLLDVLKVMRSDNDELNQTRKTNDALIDQLQAQISHDEETVKALSTVSGYLDKLADLDPLNTRLSRIADLFSNASSHRESGKSLVARYKAAKDVSLAASALDDHFTKFSVRFKPLSARTSLAYDNFFCAKSKLKDIEVRLNALSALKDPAPLIRGVGNLTALIDRANSSLGQVAKCEQKLSVSLPELDLSRYRRLSELLLKAHEALFLAVNLRNKAAEQSKLLDDLQSSLSEFKVCPFCNKPLE